MIASCPQCDARYRVKDEKIPDRGARITCPKCGHRFVVHKERAAAAVEEAPRGVPVTFSRKGQVARGAPTDEDDSDLPTTVMPHGSSLAAEIRAAIRAAHEEPAHEPAPPEPPARAAKAVAPPPDLRAARRTEASGSSEDSFSLGRLLGGVFIVACLIAVTFLIVFSAG